MDANTPAMTKHRSSFTNRAAQQRARLALPPFPTTTIGSLPQTPDVRRTRAAYEKGTIGKAEYEIFLQKKIAHAVRWQEEVGLDVLVHGEFERSDMVQYFAERLSGFIITKHGWVQSYGAYCARPPILFGDVARPQPMTLDQWQYAQAQTRKPVKAMLTGPTTILGWSFVREDLPRVAVGRQIALAIRDEIRDLENAGAAVIQIDEPALREGLPLRKDRWDSYLQSAVESFLLCTSAVSEAIQIHTHMCYSDFNDIVDAIVAMDADVVSLEASGSEMQLLDALRTSKYSNSIGVGVYDVRSPRIPTIEEITGQLQLARQYLSETQLWINPDCGLKNRTWEEAGLALSNMIAAAQLLRRSG